MRRVLPALVVLALLTGCGGGDGESEPTDTGTRVSVYWLRDGKVWPTLRIVGPAERVASAAMLALFQGPTEQEGAELGLATEIPDAGEKPEVSIEEGIATVQLDVELVDEALAQVVYTLTQFPTVERVEIQKRIVTRADFEDDTPAVLVESPLPFDEVTSPLRVTGTANTFEANFQYELTDTDGLIIAEDFVTATSGTGTRGTFELTVPFTIKFDGVGSLIVFEPSAKDGSRTNLVEIPIRMTQ